MVFFNYSTMQMAAKVVYYGPGLCGKTTNLQHIYSHTSSGSRGEMVSLETETDRTLFFDLLPLEVGKIQGFKTRIQLYTVPGQVFYNTTRKLVLKGVDGIVFVADSQRAMEQANIESLENLRENLEEIGLTFDDVPIVLQYNKRDLRDILSVEELESALNPNEWPSFEASALTGEGVFDTLKGISKLTLIGLKQRLQKNSNGAAAQTPKAQGPASTPADAPSASSPAYSSLGPTVDVVDEPPAPSQPMVDVAEPEVPADEKAHEEREIQASAQGADADETKESPLPRPSRRGGVDILAELEKIRQQARKRSNADLRETSESAQEPEQAQETEQEEVAAGAAAERQRRASEDETEASTEAASSDSNAEESSADDLARAAWPADEELGEVDEDPSGAFDVHALPTSDTDEADEADPGSGEVHIELVDGPGELEPLAGMPPLEVEALDSPPEDSESTPPWPNHVSGNGRREIDHSFNFHPSPEALERATSLSFRLRIEDSNRSVVDTFDEAIQVTDAESLEHLLLNLRIALDPSRSGDG